MALPVGSLHVALSLAAHHADSLISDAVAGLDTVVEASVTVVSALVEDQGSLLVRARGSSGEGQQAGEYGLVGRRSSEWLMY